MIKKINMSMLEAYMFDKFKETSLSLHKNRYSNTSNKISPTAIYDSVHTTHGRCDVTIVNKGAVENEQEFDTLNRYVVNEGTNNSIVIYSGKNDCKIIILVVNDNYFYYSSFKDNDQNVIDHITHATEKFVEFCDKNYYKTLKNDDSYMIRLLINKTFYQNEKKELENQEVFLRNIKDYTSEVSRFQKRLQVSMNIVKGLRDGNKETITKIINEIELINKHEHCKEIKIQGKSIFIDFGKTNIYNDGDIYYLGNVTCVIDMSNGYEIIFDNDNRRESYWTSEDVAPHIDSCGTACFGNALEMIMEYLGNYELYATYLTLLSYIQSVNTEDVAGKNIYRWDKVDKEGNIIEYGCKDEEAKCPVCGEQITENGELLDEVVQCPVCGEQVCDGCTEYVHGIGNVCANCIEQGLDIEKCACCGELFEHSRVTYIESQDEYICDDCIKNSGDYVICDNCGKIVRIADSYTVSENGNERRLCSDCYDDEINS